MLREPSYHFKPGDIKALEVRPTNTKETSDLNEVFGTKPINNE